MLPAGNTSSYADLLTKRLLTANPQLAATFAHWHCLPGTGFQDKNLWWGSQKPRIAPHEGIDFVQYSDQQGKLNDLLPDLTVPSLFSGKIIRIHRDFLAWSLYIRHDQFIRSNKVLHTVFAHIQPLAGLLPGQQIQAAEPLALLAEYPQKTPAPLHLHFSAVWLKKNIPGRQLSWQLLADPESAILVDPFLPHPLN